MKAKYAPTGGWKQLLPATYTKVGARKEIPTQREAAKETSQKKK